MLGVRDEDREVLGVPMESLDTLERFVTEICVDSIEPQLFVRIERMELPQSSGVRAVALKVTVAPSLFVHRSPGGYLRRMGSSKRQMSPAYCDARLGARLFEQRSQSQVIYFDEKIVANSELSDLDEALWRRFESAYSRMEEGAAMLSKLALARMDEEGKLKPTVAGVLLACRDPRRFLPNAYIQAVAYRGKTVVPEDASTACQLDAKDCSGPLDEQVSQALSFVSRNMAVRARKDQGRIDTPQYDLTAVFEALVNAVAHRDYAIAGSKIRLRMFSDRLELYVPGALTNTMTVESLPLRQSVRNEAVSSLLARCPVPMQVEGLETERRTMMDRRGEGVVIVLKRSEALAGKLPVYEVIDREALRLTIFAAFERG